MTVATPARVLFDESHSEAWTIRAQLAEAMQPAHPADASYGRAAGALVEREFVVEANTDQPLSGPALERCDVLVIAHPSEPAWERTTGTGSPRLTAAELDAIEAFVRGGGGLIVLGETEQEKYGNNVNELLARFGCRLENHTVQDYEHHLGAPSWILAELAEGGRGRDGDLLARVRAACLYRATTISAGNGARVLARSHATASVPGAPLIVATEHGEGHVAVLADSDLFGDDCIGQLDHRALWLNIVYWVTRPAGNPSPARGHRGGLGVDDSPAWARLRDQTNALALLQAADGSLAGDGGTAAGGAVAAGSSDAAGGAVAAVAADRSVARGHVEAIAAALQELAPRFPHQADYLTAALADLRGWASGGFVQPDFTRALEAFRPERRRADGVEHLVFFPMYKQNGSRSTCYEALIVRVPWPAWIAELERTRYDNAKFVPVELVDGTRGYDSECAVLFPETVSVAGRTVNHFGAIFCDREAERLRRLAGYAADVLGLNLPPDAAHLLRCPARLREAYILWDLVHDRAHSHGDLPFDPFMIRQRAPYWMYALEELRCDLTAFTEAAELERRGVSFARNVQYAILLDRLLRFPITGARVRNYDGLGGQLLFAHLHRHGYVHWTDNRLTIDWPRIGDGVAGLQTEIQQLYRYGIDRSKLQHWSAAHDLVAARVPPAAGSRWAAAVRDFPDIEDPRPYVDLVLDDEFPLSIFYTSLKAKCGALGSAERGTLGSAERGTVGGAARGAVGSAARSVSSTVPA